LRVASDGKGSFWLLGGTYNLEKLGTEGRDAKFSVLQMLVSDALGKYSVRTCGRAYGKWEGMEAKEGKG